MIAADATVSAPERARARGVHLDPRTSRARRRRGT